MFQYFYLQKSSTCTVFKNEDKSVPNLRRRPIRQGSTPSTTPNTLNLAIKSEEKVPMAHNDKETQETKFEATVYQTLLKLLQGTYQETHMLMIF